MSPTVIESAVTPGALAALPVLDPKLDEDPLDGGVPSVVGDALSDELPQADAIRRAAKTAAALCPLFHFRPCAYMATPHSLVQLNTNLGWQPFGVKPKCHPFGSHSNQ